MTIEKTAQYYYVVNGVVMGPSEVYIGPYEVTQNPFGRPTYVAATSIGGATTDADLAVMGVYREWLDDGGEQPSPYHVLSVGPPVVVEDRVEVVCSWVMGDPADTREKMLADIRSQVPVYSGTDIRIDPEKEYDVARYASAATDKVTELSVVPDEDLALFDTTLVVASPQATGVVYSNLALTIDEQEPWAGAPDAVLGFHVTLRVEPGLEDEGAEARVQVLDAPADAGAVLPLVQDIDDPALWSVKSRDGFKWSDPEASCTLQLLWGAGSLPVAPAIMVAGLHDRTGVIVRYGMP